MPRLAAYPRFPSVTEVLAAVGLTPSYDGIAPHYAQLGTAVHETVAWHADGVLDEASLHPDVRVRLDAYLAFVAATQHKPFASEVELVHAGWGVVGHADRVGSLVDPVHGRVETALLDWKCSQAPDIVGATYQVAGGYRALWDYCHPERPIEHCYVVALRRDGTYRLHDVTDTGHAIQVFCAAVVVYHAKKAATR